MTTKLEQAARQALDALENAYENGFLTGITGLKTIDIITALREALAEQAEQEPVAYVYEKDVAGIGMRKDVAFTKHVEVGTDLYAAPVRTKDLTDQEIADVVVKTLVVDDERFEFQGGRIITIRESELLPTARAVIAADREKNK